ncbi:hypothetical protein ACVXHA_14160 [Escherichia coli]
MTTTDELIPSGETSSHRSIHWSGGVYSSRRDPGYVGKKKRLLSWKISVGRECQRADRGVCAH